MFGLLKVKLTPILAIVSCCAFGQSDTNFIHISPQLNNRTISVTKTTQDTYGNIWMLTKRGVLVYNGYDYTFIDEKTIFPDLTDKDAIKNVDRDKNGNIWIVSVLGLVSKYTDEGVFEDFSGKFGLNQVSNLLYTENAVWFISFKGEVYRFEKGQISRIFSFNRSTILNKRIIDFELSKNRIVYVGTDKGNIYGYNLKTGTEREIVGAFTDYPSNINLAIDESNKLWIGTETYGLFVYDTATEKFIEQSFLNGNKYNIYKELFLCLIYTSEGYIIAGTDGGGLYKINAKTGRVELFTQKDTNRLSLTSNTVIDISEDSHKNLWISTNYGGLNILPGIDSNIHYHSGSDNDSPTRILSMYKSSNKDLWIGTDGSGITRITYNAEGKKSTGQYFKKTQTGRGFYVQSIQEAEHGKIWFGTYKNGLWVYNPTTNKFQKKKVVNLKNQEGTDIRTVFIDSKKRLWVGSNVALNIYNPDFKLLASYENGNAGLNGSITQSIIEDNNHIIWLGQQDGGFLQFDENVSNLQQSSFINHVFENDPGSDLGVKSMATSEDSMIWLVTNLEAENRVLQFNTKTTSFNRLKILDSLNDIAFSSILAEDKNNLWLSSISGIYHLNIAENTVERYGFTDGLQDDWFLSRSAFKDRNGNMYFGGIKGLNIFDPNAISKEKYIASLYVNSIEVLNQPAKLLLPDQITSHVNNVASLELNHSQSSFSFGFAAVGNVLNPKYHYLYRLKGFDEKWIPSNSAHIATYTNIPPGDYSFEVKAGTKQGIWEIPVKQTKIKILRPLWSTTYAYLFYLVIFTLVGLGLKRWYGLRKKLFLQKVIHKKESEVHREKMNFFAKMSHEIQTPITLILGPIDDMLTRSEESGNLLLKQRLNIISNNAKRLSRIARDLTLVRNRELNKLELLVTENNLCNHVDDICLSFKELARNKKIDFVTNYPKNLCHSWYDKEKIEHVIYNLLSNAFKFTHKDGFIQLNVVPTNSKKKVKISVQDSGPGISKEELETIFQLFYQSNIGKKNKWKGTGIGLALTKELIDLHKGKIEVESNLNEGTTFTVTLPISEKAYRNSERITISKQEKPEVDSIKAEKLKPKEEPEIHIEKKTLLIVEDNYDLQSFLKNLFVSDFNILLAENGEEGYHYAKSNYPDIILSDILMPKMDGIEMCNKLQEDSLTKHIPIILLTAKNSTTSKISGLKSGAIEYIQKPFNTNELLLKVKNIVSSKEYIISKYRKEVVNNPDLQVEKTQDEQFLEDLVAEINKRIEEPNFKMELLAKSLNMSYSSLYRRCQTLTGYNVIDFVRVSRLKKAAVLISKYGYNISEAAFKAGFNDPKYFSKRFKKHFKKTPIEFKKEAEKQGSEAYLKKYNL